MAYIQIDYVKSNDGIKLDKAFSDWLANWLRNPIQDWLMIMGSWQLQITST